MSPVITMANLASQPYFSAYACTLGKGGEKRACARGRIQPACETKLCSSCHRLSDSTPSPAYYYKRSYVTKFFKLSILCLRIDIRDKF